MSIIERSGCELKTALDSGELTAVAITEEFLARIEACDEQIGAFLRVDRTSALEQAERIDSKRGSGEPIGLLSGLPVALKDLLCTEGVPTTCASRMLQEFVPPYDATVVTKLRQADAVLIGKTNMDEFAMGSSTEASAIRPTKNPWDLQRVPGGSSGGAAACVAAGMAPLSIGSDTGGSIRQPAAFCGVVGMKPTYGRVSRYGLIAFASSLDQLGPMAHTVEDAALLLEVMAGHDPCDSTSAKRDVPRYSQTVNQPLQDLKLGLVREYMSDGLNTEVESSVREAIKVYQSRGAQIVDVSLPHGKYAIATYYVIAPCEASSNLARYDGIHYGLRADEGAMLKELEQQRARLEKSGDERGLERLDSPLIRLYRKSRSQGFGDEVKRRIMLGTYALSAGYYDAYYLKALKVRRLIRNDFDAAFKQCDFIIGPVTPNPAYRLGEKSNDPLSMYLDDLYTVSANLAGLPGISLPCGISGEGLPIGLQLLAPPFEEERLLRVAAMFQSATDWHLKRATLG